MSQWTVAEVEELEKAGNASAREVWLATLATDRGAQEPSSHDPQQVRNFLRQKYVEKRWFKAKTEEKRNAEEKASAVQEVESVEEKKPAKSMPVEDLLGDVETTTSRTTASAPAPSGSLLDIAPPPVTEAPLLGTSAQPLVTSAGAEWTADFGVAQQQAATLQAQVPQKGGLFDLDFSSSAPASGSSEQDRGSGLMALDFSSNAPAASASLQGLNFPTAAPAVAAASDDSTPGERLRQALMSGTGNELNKLFEQSRQPEEVCRTLDVPSADRFQALQGNLGNLFSSSQPMQAQMNSCPFGMPPMNMQPAMQPLSNMLALPPVPGMQNFQTNSLMAPTMGGFPSSARQQNSAPMWQSQTGYLQTPSAPPTAFAPPVGAPTSAPFPMFSGPPNVGEHMGGMAGYGFQAQGNSFGLKLPSSPNGNARTSSGYSVPTSPTQPTASEEHSTPPKECQFGDLLAAFHEKHPINGLGQDGLRILA
jgi:hypothetical protein